MLPTWLQTARGRGGGGQWVGFGSRATPTQAVSVENFHPGLPVPSAARPLPHNPLRCPGWGGGSIGPPQSRGVEANENKTKGVETNQGVKNAPSLLP